MKEPNVYFFMSTLLANRTSSSIFQDFAKSPFSSKLPVNVVLLIYGLCVYLTELVTNQRWTSPRFLTVSHSLSLHILLLFSAIQNIRFFLVIL